MLTKVATPPRRPGKTGKNGAKQRALQQIGTMILTNGRGPAVVGEVAEMIRQTCNYRWVGIYKISRRNFVIVAATGSTPPTYPSFPVTQGISSAALETRQTIVLPDVRKDLRYLPTFGTTRSEIVVPIIDDEDDRVVGIINVESEKLNAFDKSDRDFLESVARVLWRACK